MTQFKVHENCPKCGSRDNVAVWEDGSKYCFTQGCDFVVISKEYAEKTVRSGAKFFRLPDLETVPESVRGISVKTLNAYRVGMTDAAIVFPYTDHTGVVGAKFRGLDNWSTKNFWYKGNSLGLFGIQTARKGKPVILCEGEFDALAAYEMMGFTHNCLSVAHGASGASADIGKHIEWLGQYGTIYVCFDGDTAGDDAATKAMTLFRPGKVKRVTLPTGYKDANAMLEAGKVAEFRQALEEAQGFIPEGFITTKEVFAELREFRNNPDAYKGMSTGYYQLDKLMGGIKPGEITILCGDTGSGKTNFSEQVAYNAISRGVKVLWISLEMPTVRVAEQFIEKHLMKQYYTTENVINVSDYDVLQAEAYFTDKLHLYRNFGQVNVEKIGNAIIHAQAQYGVGMVVLDHLALLTTGKDFSAIDAVMSELNSIALANPVCIWAVAQLSRNTQIRGSNGINQIASSIVRLVRDRRTSIATLHNPDKTYRYSPDGYGKFYLEYEKSTRTFKEISDSDALRQIEKDTNGDSQTSTGKYTFLRPKEAIEPGKEPIREHDNTEQSAHSINPVRTDTTVLHDNKPVYSGLQHYIENRKADIYRVQGISPSVGQTTAAGCDSTESTHRLAAFISELSEENIFSQGCFNLR